MLQEYDPEKDCFYNPRGMSCAQMNHTVHTAGQTAACRNTPGKSPPRLDGTNAHEAPKHYTGADTRMRQYYTPQIAQIVRELYRADFDMFGYSLDIHSVMQGN